MISYKVPSQLSDVCFISCLSGSKAIAEASYINKVQIVTMMIKECRKMKQWASNCTVNFKHRYELMNAELHRVCHQYKSADSYYKAAIRTAIESDQTMDLAITYECSAHFYLDTNQAQKSTEAMNHAIRAYQSWGATAKAHQLESTRSCWS